jgi:glycosyltransferase involved in cell wall biosynthesis
MLRKHVVIVKNFYPVERDPRLIKLFKMLEGTGYFITYLGWNRDAATLNPKEQVKCKNRRDIVLQAKAPFGPKSFLFLPLWWFFVLRWLLRLKWDVAHIVNFPSVIPAIIASRLKNRPIIYDVEDTYADQLNLRRLDIVRLLGIMIERLSMKFVNAVVLVDDMQVEEFRGIPNPNLAVIYDSPSPLLSYFVKASEKEKDSFTIFYAGYLSQSRHLNIQAIIEAVETIEGVGVIFAGDGDLVEGLKAKELETHGKVQYIGWIPYDKVLEMSYKSDLLFSLREPNPPVQKYICGSKFLEATMCGKPILVNKGTSAAVKTTQDKCGLVVDTHNLEEIKEAISKLKNDKEFWRKTAINARKAYEQKYGWEIMKQRLLELYSMTLKKRL